MTLPRPAAAGDLGRVGWMTAAMAAFAVEDALLKVALAGMPVSQVLVLFGLGGAAGFAGLARLSGARISIPGTFSRPMAVRSLCEIAGRLFHVLALTLAPLSVVTAILQAGPVLVVAGAALLFGERAGLGKWAAIALSLAGVALVLRPDGADYSAAALLAVLGMLGTVGRDLAARALPQQVTGAAVGVSGFLATAIAGLLAGIWEQSPPALPGTPALLALLAAIIVGMLAYSGLIRATRTGPAAIVTPFRYTRLIFGLAIGLTVFGETLDSLALAGCALILISGLAVLRGTRQPGRPQSGARRLPAGKPRR
jgi:drug/metabolite transporter (DMT)-like permease